LQIQETSDGVVGDELRDLLRRPRSLRAEPVGGPIQGAEESARRDGGVGGVQDPEPDAAGDQRADAALVAIAFDDDAGTKARRKGIHLEVRGRPFDFVNQTEDVRDRHVAEAGPQRPPILARGGERFEQPIHRAVLAEEQELVLAAEVVIEVAG
jgi:hypothetical protein